MKNLFLDVILHVQLPTTATSRQRPLNAVPKWPLWRGSTVQKMTKDCLTLYCNLGRDWMNGGKRGNIIRGLNEFLWKTISRELFLFCEMIISELSKIGKSCQYELHVFHTRIQLRTQAPSQTFIPHMHFLSTCILDYLASHFLTWRNRVLMSKFEVFKITLNDLHHALVWRFLLVSRVDEVRIWMRRKDQLNTKLMYVYHAFW